MKAFVRNECGSVLVWTAVLLPVLLGVAGMSIDAGRLYIVNTDMQHVADAAALAAASELDGTTGAITRATAAATALTNGTLFASDNPTVKVVTPLVFYKSNAGSFIGCSNAVTTVDAEAACVQVRTVTRSITTSFIRAVGWSSDAQTAAVASAESRYIACEVSPLALCVPDVAAFPTVSGVTLSKGSNILIQADPTNGNFGLLDPVTGGCGNSAPCAEEHVAQTSPQFCFSQGINLVGGKKAGPVDNGFNSRLDDKKANGDYAPAPNIMSEYPVDSNISSANRYGNRDWISSGKLTTYLNTYHAANPGFIATVQAAAPAGTLTSRYELYLMELGLNPATADVEKTPVSYAATQTMATMPANGTWYPTNFKPMPATLIPDRRLIYIAILSDAQCSTNAPITNVSKLAKVFITRLAGDSSPAKNGEVVVEYINQVTAGDDDGKLHHIVQLVKQP